MLGQTADRLGAGVLPPWVSCRSACVAAAEDRGADPAPGWSRFGPEAPLRCGVSVPGVHAAVGEPASALTCRTSGLGSGCAQTVPGSSRHRLTRPMRKKPGRGRARVPAHLTATSPGPRQTPPRPQAWAWASATPPPCRGVLSV